MSLLNSGSPGSSQQARGKNIIENLDSLSPSFTPCSILQFNFLSADIFLLYQTQDGKLRAGARAPGKSKKMPKASLPNGSRLPHSWCIFASQIDLAKLLLPVHGQTRLSCWLYRPETGTSITLWLWLLKTMAASANLSARASDLRIYTSFSNIVFNLEIS